MIFLALLAIAAAAVYFYIRHLYSYWDRMGVESLPSTFPFGNLGPNIRQKLSLGQLAGEIYKKGTGPLIGVFYCFRPTIVLRDPDLIRNICGADFKYFYHRGFHVDEKNDTTAANMFFSNGEPWKRMREKLSPAFTSGKLKGMFNTILACGKTVQDYMDPFADRAESLEVREVFARYSTNIIASVAFGLEVDCVTNPDNEFRRNGMAFFEVNLRNALRQFLRIVSPTLSRLLRVRITDHKVQEFMTSMVKQNLDYREQNNIVRKDFFQLLMDLHRTGAVQLDDEWKTVIGSKTSQPLTIDEITAHALIFFVAAFETSSSTMSFCLLELAKNPEIQRKVQAEIDAAGEISYDTIDEMKYLDCCVNETLRKHPPLTVFSRECMEDYKVPNTDITIEKGTFVVLPLMGLHRDPKYYPEPEKFDPERFSARNTAGKTFLDQPFMPFGIGQRICIGMRLGKLQVKVGLILMLQKYNFALGSEHLWNEIELDPNTILNTPKYDMPLIVTKRRR